MALKNHVFTYPGRQRWAYVPTIAFLVVIALILWLSPGLIFARGMNPPGRNAAIALALLFAVFLGASVLDRWLQPFSVILDGQAMTVRPLLRSERRVAYEQITGVIERGATFFRHVPELEIRLSGAARLVIRGDISDYADLVRALRQRVPRSVASAWVEAPRPAARGRR